jgi:RES domain-containing protein
LPPAPFDLAAFPLELPSWRDAARIQPWHFAEAEFWSERADVDQLPALLTILRLTEPDAYRTLGCLDRLDSLDVMRGEGAGWVMPAFTWGGPGRFNPADMGCFYAGRDLETAVAETVHHQNRILSEAGAPALEIRLRVLRTDIDAPAALDLPHDAAPEGVFHPDDYTASQSFGVAARQAGADAIAYDSVRRRGGRAIAVFEPSTILRCTSDEMLVYLWDGARVAAVEKRTPLEWID